MNPIIILLFFVMGIAPNLVWGAQSKQSSELTRLNIFNESIMTIPSDFVAMGQYPIDHPWVTTGLVIATVGLITVDKPTTTFIQRKVNPALTWSPRALDYGDGQDGYLLLGVGGLYLGGALFDSPINQIGALATAKSMIYSGIISQLALKAIFGRIRPNPDLSVPCTTRGYTNNPWDFFHGSKVTFQSANGPTSMPSFHFSLYFAAGTALSQTYNSYWPYLITAAGLLPDFGSHHHWVSDMFAGAAIGTLIGYTVTNNLKNKLGLSDRETIMIEPSLEQRGVRLTYKLEFDSPNVA